MAKTSITIEVRPEKQVIDINGKIYDVFVCDVPALEETCYVTEDGLLVKVNRPDQEVEIVLAPHE